MNFEESRDQSLESVRKTSILYPVIYTWFRLKAGVINPVTCNGYSQVYSV